MGNVRVSGQFPQRSLTAKTLPLLAAILLTSAGPLAARDIVLRPVAEVERTPSPLLLLVSIRKQKVRVFDVNGEFASSRISSGQPGFDTPTGVFSILEKNQTHFSNIYDGAPMPFMQRITWSGIAFHAGVVPGYRASHGCIRLPHSFAKSLFGLTRTGARVIISQDEAQPVRFEHANLFKPLPVDAIMNTGALATGETKVAVNDTGPDQPDAMPLFTGISSAFAGALPSRPRSRTEADRMMSEKISNLQAGLKSAEAAKVAASEKAKIVLKETEAAAATLANERKVIETVRATINAADQRKAAAIRAFEAYMKGEAAVVEKPDQSLSDRRSRRRAGKRDAEIAARPEPRSEDREANLEDAIVDLTIAADRVRDEAAKREMAFAGVQASLARANADREAAIAAVRDTQIELKSTQTALIEANKEQVRRAKPLSVFVSLKSKRIFLRQGFEPVLDAPIAVEMPAGPVGTHVLTAMRYGADPNAFDWRLVSAHTPAAYAVEQTAKKNKRREAQPTLPLSAGPNLAKAALDAIQIPEEIQDKIRELARPGASFIVSDRDMNPKENGPGTEFVVLTR